MSHEMLKVDVVEPVSSRDLLNFIKINSGTNARTNFGGFHGHIRTGLQKHAIKWKVYTYNQWFTTTGMRRLLHT